jgi:hypothetical protein
MPKLPSGQSPLEPVSLKSHKEQRWRCRSYIIVAFHHHSAALLEPLSIGAEQHFETALRVSAFVLAGGAQQAPASSVSTLTSAPNISALSSV